MAAKKSPKLSRWKKIAVSFLGITVISGVWLGMTFYRQIFSPNVQGIAGRESFLMIPTGAEFPQVMRLLQEQNLLLNSASFQWVAERMGYTGRIKPGRYRIKAGMSNKELIRLLRSGKQEPVQVTFNNIRTIAELCGIVGSYLEADSFSLCNLLTNPAFLKKNGFTQETIPVIFIPNTYEFYWNTSAEQFFDRMKKEYDKFWTPARLALAKEIGLTPVQVSVLASIVEKETTRNDEKPVIAGVYMNRYKKGWKLEADPTLVFALGDFTVRRVLNEHKTIDSPYNTYLHEGLPPGPICMPSLSSIQAVLKYSRHSYLFFCARDDFSGYHAFARDYATHLINARRFQKELNRRNIRS